MAENVLLAEQRFEGFALNSEYGAYAYDIYPAPASLVLGETYTVVWDGVAYACSAQDVSFLLPGGIGLGNLADFGGIGNGEPFVIGWLNPSDGSGGGVTLFSFDTQLAHTAAVHQVVADETLPGIVLEDFNGNDSVHNKDRVMFDTSDGGTQIFSKGEAVDGVVIPLDLSEGHQTVTAPAGTLVRSATILKPEDLASENIRYGRSIAGFDGTFIGDTEEKIIDGTNELTFADGDFVIVPSKDGKVLSKVTITRPKTLIPEKIAEGWEIAGLVGTYAGADHTITYMKDDGVTVLYEKGVMHGDTCGDIIALGLIDTPTKEPSGDQASTFSGWAASIGGKIDSAVLASVTENRTVYAVFAAIVASGTCAEGVNWQLDENGGFTVFGEGAMGDYTETNIPWLDYIGSIKSVTIKEGITSIGSRAFLRATALSEVFVPDSVSRIGRSAFNGCASLRTITIPDTVTTLEDMAFRGCSSLTSVVIPYGVTSVGSYLCYECTALGSVSIPDTVTNIGDFAFGDCESLTSITLPSNLTTMKNAVFVNCIGLTSIVIPATVTKIGSRAFGDCTNLATVTFEATSGWWVNTSNTATSGTSLSATYLSRASTAAIYLRTTYTSYYWRRN